MSKIDLQQKMTIAIPLYFFASINQTVCMLIMLGANQYSFEIRLKIILLNPFSISTSLSLQATQIAPSLALFRVEGY